MTGRLEWLWLAIVSGWVAHALTVGWAGPTVALGVAGIVGAFVIGARATLPVSGLMALLSPVGVVLPALAVRDVAGDWGMPVAMFETSALIAFLAAHLMLLASAMGAVPVDLYRIGYAPVPVALMVLAVCAYGMITGTLFLPLVAVIGQALWMTRLGSSNWFDHVSHALLVPVVVGVLILRLV